MKPTVKFQWIKDLSYKEAWDLQTSIHQQLVQSKLAKRQLPESELLKDQKHRLIFCEHSPVFTLGKSGTIDHLLLTDDELASNKIEFFKI